MTKLLISSTLAAAAIASPALAQKTIEDIAPDSSFFVIGTDNLQATVEQFKAGRVWSVLQSDEFKEDFAPQVDELKAKIEEMEQNLQLEEGTLDYPKGSVGAAFFLSMVEELGLELPGVIAIIDFAGEEERATALFDKSIEHLEESGREPAELEVAGHTVYSFDTSPPLDEEDQEEMGDDDPFGGGAFGGQQALSDVLATGFKTMYTVRIGETVLVSSSFAVLQNAIDAVEGEDIQSVGDRGDYRAAMDQVGKRDLHYVLNLRQAVKLLYADPMMMFTLPMFSQIVHELGIDGLLATSGSFDFAPQGGGAIDLRSGVLVDGEKRGLVALLAEESPREGVPTFVGPGVMSYARYNFNFGGVMDLVGKIVRSVPPQMQPDAQQFLLEYGPDLNAVFNSLGREIHISQTDQQQTLTAVPCTNTDRFISVATKYASMMQLTPREFLGQVIFSHVDPNAQFAVGVGGGRVYLGDARSVEDALRTTGRNDLPTLANDVKFRAIEHHLPIEPVTSWGYTDMAATIDASIDQFQMMQAMGALPVPDMPDMPDMPLQNFDFERLRAILKEIFGPSVWQIRSVDNGFVMQMQVHPPVDE